MLQPFITPIPSRFISTILFSVPQGKNKVKRTPLADVAEIQEAVTDELKKVQRQEFSAAFQKMYNHTKEPADMSVVFILNNKKVLCLPHVSRIFKKISPKSFGPHCVQTSLHHQPLYMANYN
jgi:hypothetical protein